MEFKGKYTVEIRKSLTHGGDEVVATLTDGNIRPAVKVVCVPLGRDCVENALGTLFNSMFPDWKSQWAEKRVKEIEEQNGL